MAKNLLTGAAFTFDTLEASTQQFLTQTKPNGAPLGIVPSLLLVPIGLRGKALQIRKSEGMIPSLVTSASANRGIPGSNIYAGAFDVVCSQYLSNATLSGYSATSWYQMARAESNVYSIEAAFLNGQEMPIIERDDMSFDRLGIGFRWWLSYGVGMGEPRSAILNQA